MTQSEPFRILRNCFSDAEWQWLGEEPGFQMALAEINNLDDAENASRIGHDLITLAEEGNHPSERKPPPLSRHRSGRPLR